MRLVQARENRKCEYQNRYYDPEYFIHKIPGDATNPVRRLHGRLWASMPHIIFFSGKNQTEFPKKLNFAKPVLRGNFAALTFRQIYRKI